MVFECKCRVELLPVPVFAFFAREENDGASFSTYENENVDMFIHINWSQFFFVVTRL